MEIICDGIGFGCPVGGIKLVTVRMFRYGDIDLRRVAVAARPAGKVVTVTCGRRGTDGGIVGIGGWSA